jgi:hypothetical protein
MTPMDKTPTNKTAFVKSLPSNLPAKTVVAKAKKVGLSINEKYVYAIRSKARSRTGTGRVRRGRPPTRRGFAADAVMSFRRLALHLGLKQAEDLIEEMKRKIEAVLHGR